MCGRYTIGKPDPREWSHLRLIPDWEPSFDLRPTQSAPVIVMTPGGAEIRDMRWGLIPSWSKGRADERHRSTFNARSETAATKPTFRDAYKKRRCVVPASGFFEWKRVGKDTVKHWIYNPLQPSIGFAGLWEEWRGAQNVVHSFTVLTCKPNRRVAELHDRMPVILPPHHMAQWLSGRPEDVGALLQPANENDTHAHPVDKNAIGPDAICELEDRQLSLL